MSVIDEVKQRTDIVEVVNQYTTLTKAGRTFKALCPLHSEKHPSFFVYPEQQSWHCFGACNTGGDVFSFIMKKEGIARVDVLEVISHHDTTTQADTKEQKKEETYLDKFTIELVALAETGKIDPVVGRLDEIERVMQTLCRRKKN